MYIKRANPYVQQCPADAMTIGDETEADLVGWIIK
jgi:hypothetical protein